MESIEWIESHIEGYDFESFSVDRKTIDAVTHCLEIVGEAAKHLPDTLTEQHPDMPWRFICGFRDVLAHSYFRTKDFIIWDAATRGAQQLKPVIEALLK